MSPPYQSFPYPQSSKLEEKPLVFDNEMYILTPVAGEDVCAEPGNYDKGWAFCQTAQTTPYQPHGELEEDGMCGILGRRRKTNTKKGIE